MTYKNLEDDFQPSNQQKILYHTTQEAEMTNHTTKTDFNKTCSTEQNNTEGPSVIIMNAEEFCQNKENFPHNKELLHSLGSIRYCKAELFNDCIQGTLRIPKKSENYQTCLLYTSRCV